MSVSIQAGDSVHEFSHQRVCSRPGLSGVGCDASLNRVPTIKEGTLLSAEDYENALDNASQQGIPVSLYINRLVKSKLQMTSAKDHMQNSL